MSTPVPIPPRSSLSNSSPQSTSLGKYALVTGCGEGGIGQALIRQLVQRGFTVIATLLPFESSEHLKHPDIRVVKCDVTSEEQTLELKKQIQDMSEGRLDALFNNAGICYTMTAADTDVVQVEKMFAVNVLGPMRMVHHFHKMLVKAKGVVVNIGSVGGIVPYIYGASYNASKAALHHYGNTLRAEMKPFGVRVVTVISGEVGTNILKGDKKSGRKLPEGSIYQPICASFENHIARTPKTITPDQYASGVVNEILKQSPAAWFWYGPTTSLVRWCDMLLPRVFWDALFWRMFGFDALRVSSADSEVAA